MYIGTGVYSFIVNVIAIVSGFLFTLLIIKDRKLLSDHLPKSYFTWMTIGAVIFTLSFALDFIYVFVVNELWMLDSVHHLLLILSGIIFIFTNMNLLQEVRQEKK